MASASSVSGKDGKEAVSTTASLLGNIGKLVFAIRVLYAVNEKFPSLFPKIKAGAMSAASAMMRFGAVKKVVDFTSGALQKFGDKFPKLTSGIKSTGAALGKMPGLVMGVTGGIGKMEQVTGLLMAIGAPAIAAGILGLVAVLTACATALTVFTSTRISAAAKVADLSDALESTTDQIQAMNLAMGAVGANSETFTAGIENIQSSVSKAVTGNEEYVKSFSRIGISLNDLKNTLPADLFLKISESVKDGKIGAANFASLVKVMGSEAKKLKPAMQDDFAGLTEFYKKLAVPATFVAAMDEANTAISKTIQTVKGAINLAVSSVVGAPLHYLKFLFGKEGDQWGSSAALTQNKELKAKLALKQSIRGEEESQAAVLKVENDEKEKSIALDKMSVLERKKALEAERDLIKIQMAGTKNVLAKENLRKKLLELEQDLSADSKPDKSSESGEARQLDSLTRIGLFRGSNPNGIINAIQRQVLIQQRQLDVAQKQIVSINKIDSGIQGVNRLLKENA